MATDIDDTLRRMMKARGCPADDVNVKIIRVVNDMLVMTNELPPDQAHYALTLALVSFGRSFDLPVDVLTHFVADLHSRTDNTMTVELVRPS